jgi:hypothetical protein
MIKPSWLLPFIALLSLMANGFLISELMRRPATITETEIVRTVDTLYSTREIVTTKIWPPDPVIMERIDTMYLIDTLRISQDDLGIRRIYEDSLQQDGATMKYRHSIIGVLEHSQYSFTIPERTIREKETITNTIRNRWSIDVMAGVGVGLRDDVLIGAQVRTPKLGMYYQYGVMSRSHHLGFVGEVLGR